MAVLLYILSINYLSLILLVIHRVGNITYSSLISAIDCSTENLSISFIYRSVAARRPTATHKFRLPIALRRLAACVLGASLILLRGKSRQKRA